MKFPKLFSPPDPQPTPWLEACQKAGWPITEETYMSDCLAFMTLKIYELEQRIAELESQ